MLAGLFGDAVGLDDVEVFPFELPATSVLQPHVHTSDLAAWVTEGRMAFGFGEGFTERIEVGPGDLTGCVHARRTRRRSSAPNARAWWLPTSSGSTRSPPADDRAALGHR